jgi:hypothetical protein
MDSLLVEALIDTRHALDALDGVAAAQPLRIRRDLVELAVKNLDLTSSPPSHVTRVAELCLSTRDLAVAMRDAHRVVADAIREAMD